jgi:hypothetical protein
MGQRIALARCAGRQQQGAHARGLADADRAHVRLDVLHGVVDGHPCGDDAARRVDVQADVLLGILRLEEQHLREDHVGDVVIDRSHQEDHPLLEQPRIDVVRTLTPAGLFDHHRHEVQGLGSIVHLHDTFEDGFCRVRSTWGQPARGARGAKQRRSAEGATSIQEQRRNANGTTGLLVAQHATSTDPLRPRMHSPGAPATAFACIRAS